VLICTFGKTDENSSLGEKLKLIVCVFLRENIKHISYRKWGLFKFGEYTFLLLKDIHLEKHFKSPFFLLRWHFKAQKIDWFSFLRKKTKTSSVFFELRRMKHISSKNKLYKLVFTFGNIFFQIKPLLLKS